MIEGVMTDSDGRLMMDGIGTNDLLDLTVRHWLLEIQVSK